MLCQTCNPDTKAHIFSPYSPSYVFKKSLKLLGILGIIALLFTNLNKTWFSDASFVFQTSQYSGNNTWGQSDLVSIPAVASLTLI